MIFNHRIILPQLICDLIGQYIQITLLKNDTDFFRKVVQD
jgi:hypothetical protein